MISGAFPIYALTSTVMRHANSIGNNRNLLWAQTQLLVQLEHHVSFENVVCPEGAPHE